MSRYHKLPPLNPPFSYASSNSPRPVVLSSTPPKLASYQLHKVHLPASDAFCELCCSAVPPFPIIHVSYHI